MSNFKHELRASVVIKGTDTIATVIARSESVRSQNQYLVEYVKGGTELVEQWFCEEQLFPV